MAIEFESMNETDVREVIVRPLLHRLGYAYGTESAIRTEVNLKYDYAFLGRKKPGKDAELRGRADYICDVASHGRLTVEVKSPSEPITTEAIQQAHTYAAHPEIAADFFMVTNGRVTEVYKTGRLKEPLISVSYEGLEDRILELKNLIGAEAIRTYSAANAYVAGKPLGEGLGPEVSIIGGTVNYDEHSGGHPLLMDSGIDGLKLPITGGRVFRSADGLLNASVSVAQAFPLMRELHQLIGHDEYAFRSTDEYFSADPEKPTILQNFIDEIAPKGTPMTIPGLGRMQMPFRYEFKAFTEAIGYVDGRIFKGLMRLEYDMGMYDMDPMVAQALAMKFGDIPQRTSFIGTGTFEVRLSR